MTQLKNLKKGDFFKRKPDAKRVWVKDDYDRSSKKYCCYAWDDVNQFIFIAGTKEVDTDFIF